MRWDNIAVGLTIFFIGLFKKTVLADGIAPHSTTVFDAAAAGTALPLLDAWGGALAYTLRLYFDFSGYCDMAIGLSRLFGINLPLNFNSPYKAENISDFWRRWHMTLSRFLRDYLYIPLGGNRRGGGRRYLNLIVTMLLGGLWHGANWTFVVWGGLHGLYLVVNHAWHALRHRLGWKNAHSRGGRLAAQALTFLAVVVAWVFFRATSFDAALVVLQGDGGAERYRDAVQVARELGRGGRMAGAARRPLPRFADVRGGAAPHLDRGRARHRLVRAEHAADHGAVRPGARLPSRADDRRCLGCAGSRPRGGRLR